MYCSLQAKQIVIWCPALLLHCIPCISSPDLLVLEHGGDMLPQQPKPTAVKPTHRPIFPRSRKNVDTVDEQEERDRRKFMSTGHKYWAHTPQAYHHHHKVCCHSMSRLP